MRDLEVLEGEVERSEGWRWVDRGKHVVCTGRSDLVSRARDEVQWGGEDLNSRDGVGIGGEGVKYDAWTIAWSETEVKQVMNGLP